MLYQILGQLSVCLLFVAYSPLLVSSMQPASADEVGKPSAASGYWPQWRGPLSTGVAPHAKPPLEWSEDKNVRWKVELQGLGHSTPVVWGQRIFLTSAAPYGEAMQPRYSGAPGAHDNSPITHRHRFMVLAIDRRDGKVVWQKTVREDLPHEGGHYTGSLASASPVTDGEHLFAFFGSRGLYCLDLDGRVIWKKDLGKMKTKHGHGEGSSPALHGDTLAVNWDHEGASFVAAFNKRTGKQIWKATRDELTSWATPIIVQHEGKPQLIVSGTKRVRAYELTTGQVIWQCGGLSANVCATPVSSDGMVYAASSYDTRNMLAIRLAGARGDITGTQNLVWSRTRGTPYVPSPLLYGDSLYFLRHYQGILTRLTAKTGAEQVGPFRLGGLRDIYASPVAADGRVYITGRSGTTLVVQHGEIPRVLAVNRLDDGFNASAALVGKEMYLRGERYLYCLAEESK